MSSIKINNLIISDPDICHGKPVFKGTRIMVWQILELLKSGNTKEEILKGYPSLPDGYVESALEYATKKVKESSYVPFGQN